MARFRPSRLFRRASAVDNNNNNNDSSSPSSSVTTTSPGRLRITIPSPPRTASTSHLPRKTRSLTKLRKRFGTHDQKPLPSDSQQQQHRRRDSSFAVLEPSQTGVLVDDEVKDRSPTDTTPALPLSDLDGHTPAASVEDLRLQTDALELEKAPILVVNHPTPVDVDSASPEDIHLDRAERPLSGEITLAASSEGYSASEPEQHEGAPDAVERESDTYSTAIDQPSGPPTRHPDQPPLVRRPSIVDSANAQIVDALIDAPSRPAQGPAGSAVDSFPARLPEMSAMLHRKIWVKRPGASPTMVQIREDDLVDDVRDVILRKYGNSLGKTFDSPDMTLNILTRQEYGDHQRTERVLGPEESMCLTLDSYFPGGQSVDEALVINVPQKRSTPRPSPKVHYQQSYHAMDDYRPLENGTDYFPPMPAFIPSTIPQTAGSHDSRSSHSHHHHTGAPAEHAPRSISVLSTGQVPPLPSPGAQARRHGHRPKIQRQPTSSPTIITHTGAAQSNLAQPMLNPLPNLVHRHTTRPRMDSSASDSLHNSSHVAPAPPLPTPPAPEAPPTNAKSSSPPALTPAVGAASVSAAAAAAATAGGGAGHRVARPIRKTRRSTPDKPNSASASKTRGHKPTDSNASASAGGVGTNLSNTVLDGSVPPINVLIVEDNIINLRILEGLMKRLKVRWQTAMNGQIAVDKWRLGGFHLVLMDIQMPVMSGLQATKEIRRLERINGIGVFSSSAPPTPEENGGGNGSNGVIQSEEDTSNSTSTGDNNTSSKKVQDDTLAQGAGLFKSPVIIVALTASSLQSDRHEALAAGCNDFLTKPVNFVWLERKVKEWGCMQALIDFDGWRRWKEFAKAKEGEESAGHGGTGAGKEGGGKKRKGGASASGGTGAGAGNGAGAGGAAAKGKGKGLLTTEDSAGAEAGKDGQELADVSVNGAEPVAVPQTA